MNRASKIFAILLAVLLPVSVLAGEQRKPLKVFYDAPSFSFRDSRNKLFERKNLDGKIWIANFFFTSCDGPCPIVNAHIARLAKTFRGAADVHFVSFSIDPDRDTPEKLAEYAKRFRNDGEQWSFVRTAKDQIVPLLNAGFRVGAFENPVYHSTNIVLIDAEGRIRGYYSGTRSDDIDRLESDIRWLLDQKPKSN